MKSRELRAMTDDELLDALEEKKEALFNFRFQKGFGQLEDESALRQTRRLIARIKTILRERQLSAQQGKS